MSALLNQSRPRGFLIFDATVGLTILSVLAVVLSVSVGRQRLAAEHLATSRALTEMAEETLAGLEQGHAAAGHVGDMRIAVEAAHGGSGIEGFKWVKVTVQRERQSVSLVGLAKSGVERLP